MSQGNALDELQECASHLTVKVWQALEPADFGYTLECQNCLEQFSAL